MLDPDKLRRIELPVVRQSYGERDAILYALGVGFGLDPCDASAVLSGGRFVWRA